MTKHLVTESRFPNPDAAFQTIVDAHRGLSEEQSADVNTRLVLLLANHIGDLEVLEEAISVAKESGEAE
ncbi:DUF2783 domain-containing protein [Amorphus orientalis]|uniref:DUF2783 domain-containing protein n=1 Tax=Amorphus orientalis TaxID=649198 RepID=A0AAE3VQK8_9HYPH|nr:DUF2783 domain-containing protein [Amorphus orientalis]MDQ0315951.1 hypothetical protein [Amorphus orientalis]